MAVEKFGKYTLLHKLATGGMGEVWLARQSGPAGFDRFIAVKRLLPNLAENNEFVQMFLDEARLAARLNHPNICQVYEFGREGGSYYLAMEYMHGESLSSILERSIKEKKPLKQPEVALIAAQALEGLHYAHEAKDEQNRPLNLVHRDISPSNIFVTYDGQVKLLDFGIAKAAHRITQTVAGSIKGKFGYIAPEVYKGQTIDRRVDLFAMGVVLWEMLTRRRLYKRAAEYEILRAIVEEAPPDPRSLDSSISPALADSALKALTKLPSERYQTALEMRRAISAYLRSLEEEMDAQALAEVMVNLYGQVWIELRSSVLESFREASGSVANADVLNATRTDSQISQLTDPTSALPKGNFAQAVNPVDRPGTPAPSAVGRSPSRSSMGATSISRSSGSRSQGTGRLPTMPPMPERTHSGLLIGLGSLLTLIAIGSLGAYAARGRHRADSAPAETDVAAPAPGIPGTPGTPPTPGQNLAVPTRGTFIVTASPHGALVQLDDGEERPTPFTFKDLLAGSHHRVLVHAPGYEPKSYEFDVQPGPQTYDLSLAPRQRIKTATPKPSKTTGGKSNGGGENKNVDPGNIMDPWAGH